MEAATQPILCCIGGAVAGNPTQFVMERMLDLAQLDWRVITVEVLPQELEAALAGLRAMKFNAIQILEPFGEPAASDMFPDDPKIRFVSAITSARLQANSWQGWHATGPAIRRLIAERHPWSQTVCIVCGDSVRSRSVVAACWGDQPARLIWVDAQPHRPLPVDSESSNGWLTTCPAEELAAAASEFADELQAVLLVGDSEQQMQTAAKNFQSGMKLQREAVPFYAATGEVRSTRGKQRLWNEVFSANDQLVFAMAHDFEKWTGHPSDIAHMRDAFDEYCDF